MKKVTVVTVTYGNRWDYLLHVVDAVMKDPYVTKLIIVDNGSHAKEEIEKTSRTHEGRIDIIRTEKNLGSAGGFSLGIEKARKASCDFVLLLDDDNVPEPQAMQLFMDAYGQLAGKRVVCGWRKDIQDDSVFRAPPDATKLEKTFFDVWKVEKFHGFFRKLFNREVELPQNSFYPIVPTRGFVYGGTFLPIEAVLEAPLPDKDLVLYGDDVEYSWGVLDAGYTAYLCHRPVIRDIDMTFKEGDHILGLFDSNTSLFKVYYRIRNMVLISRRNTSQVRPALALSIAVWIFGLFLLGLLKYGPTKQTMCRMKLVLQAVYGGYVAHASVPSIAQLP